MHTSLQESFGRTLIEAINLHTPVLALAYEAVNEILPDDAVIGPDWDPARTARHINKFLTGKTAREELQKRQYQHFLEKYTTEKMVETYTGILTTSRSML